MKVIISGGTGLIGRALTSTLLHDGHSVCVLSRSIPVDGPITGADYLHWGAETEEWHAAVDGVDAVVNLAGESIGSGRWTQSKKIQILQSRVQVGEMLADAVAKAKAKPAIFIQASAVGIYGTGADIVFNEQSPAGEGYLAEVAIQWEASTRAVEELGVRRAVIRTGIVLDRQEGALPQMLAPFRLGVGGPIGSGSQWMSWIHLEDEVQAILYILTRQLGGIFNLTAPNPVRNAEMGRSIARVWRKPYWLPVPAFALRTALGEMSTLVLDGQRALPESLLKAGYHFRYPNLEEALRGLLI